MSNEEIVSVEQPDIEVTVTEDALGVLHISTNNHNDLVNREGANQHPIEAIEGLQAKLAEIQTPTDTKSAKSKGYAEYRMWNPDKGLPEYPYNIGRFVALTSGSDMVEVVSDDNPNIFGVTVATNYPAFIGRDEYEPIDDASIVTGYRSKLADDDDYALVCLVGTVNVRYQTVDNSSTWDINIGDYIKSNNQGFAVKATSADACYRVIERGNDGNGLYVVINLSLSATDVKKISVNHAKESDNYTSYGNIKDKFDDIDNEIDDIEDEIDDIKDEIDDIKDGTTVVGEANHSVSADDYTDEGSIHQKFGEINNLFSNVDLWRDHVKKGDIVVGRAAADSDGNRINENYYYLHATSEEKLIVDTFDINTLCSPSDCGVYVLHYSALSLNKISGLPDDGLCELAQIEAIKLIVEADHAGNRNAVYQTLKINTNQSGYHDNYLLIYHRIYQRTGWSKWQRCVSVAELKEGRVRVWNAENANCDGDGYEITENYYSLRPVDQTRARHLGSGAALNNFFLPSQSGVYTLDWDAIREESIKNLPKDGIFPSQCAAKLIVESDYNGDEYPTVFQTLKVRATQDAHNANLLIYHRVSVGVTRDGNGKMTPQWTEWHKLMSASELSSGKVTVANATNDSDGQPINTTYAKIAKPDMYISYLDSDFAIGCLITVYSEKNHQLCSQVNNIKIQSPPPSTGINYALITDDTDGYMAVKGTWLILGICGYGYSSGYFYLAQRIE